MRQIDDAGRLLASAPPDGEDGPSGPTLVAALRDSGLLAACDTLAHHPADPRVLMRALVTVGRASLSAGRLFEGHVNAVKLLRLHGGPTEGIAQGDLLASGAQTGPIPRISGMGSCTGRSCSPAAPMCWTGSSSP